MPTKLTSIKKLGDAEIELATPTELSDIEFVQSQSNKDLWSLTLTSAHTTFLKGKGFKGDDDIVIEWEDVSGQPAVTNSYKAINGKFKEDRIEGLTRVRYALNLSAEIEIKEPGAPNPAAEIRVMVGNHVPRHPKGDWVIQQLAGDKSYIDVKALMNWVKGQDASASGLALPSAPDGLNATDIANLAKDNAIKALYTSEAALITAAAAQINEEVTKKVAEAVAAMDKAGLDTNAIALKKTETEAKTTPTAKVEAEKAAIKKAKDAAKAQLLSKLIAHIKAALTKAEVSDTPPTAGTTAAVEYATKKTNIIKKEASLYCSKVAVKICDEFSDEDKNKDKAKAAYGDQLLKDITVEIINADAGLNKGVTAFVTTDITINSKSIDKYRVVFNDFSVNMSKKLFTLDVESHDDDKVTFGAFTLKKIGVFVSNDPESIKLKYPQLTT